MEQQAPNYRSEFLKSPQHVALGLLTLGVGFMSGAVLPLIEAGKLNSEFSNLREPFENVLASKMPQVQQHASINPAAFEDFLPDGQ